MTPADIAPIVSALAWPLVIAFGLFLLRQPIRQLISRTTSLTAPGFGGAFGEPAEAAADLARNVGGATILEGATLRKQAELRPVWAQRQAYLMIRDAAEALAVSYGVNESFNSTPDRVKALEKRGFVKDDVARLTFMLRDLHYDMDKRPNAVTPSAAADFVDAAIVLTQLLRDARRTQ